jgi:hypothetical protein
MHCLSLAVQERVAGEVASGRSRPSDGVLVAELIAAKHSTPVPVPRSSTDVFRPRGFENWTQPRVDACPPVPKTGP